MCNVPVTGSLKPLSSQKLGVYCNNGVGYGKQMLNQGSCIRVQRYLRLKNEERGEDDRIIATRCATRCWISEGSAKYFRASI